MRNQIPPCPYLLLNSMMWYHLILFLLKFIILWIFAAIVHLPCFPIQGYYERQNYISETLTRLQDVFSLFGSRRVEISNSSLYHYISSIITYTSTQTGNYHIVHLQIIQVKNFHPKTPIYFDTHNLTKYEFLTTNQSLKNIYAKISLG